jgi:hypothetical protein
MSGEWDYSGNLFGGIFPAEYKFPHPAQSDGYPSMPILSAETFMNGAPAPAVDGHSQVAGPDAQNLGYYAGVPEVQEDVNQGSDSVWSNGFMGLF